MTESKILWTIIFILTGFYLFGQNESEIVVLPTEYPGALRNPMKGFTTTNLSEHPWASLTHSYIRWNELENNESDGIEKIINVCNQKWKNAGAKNMKIIPRVYLHWDGDQKYWPQDMQEDDYSSTQFKERVVRLIKRLGICWDNDPRVAFVEMGIFGKWGEQEQPAATYELQKLVSDAFAEAFKNKKVSVREVWSQFTQHPFGEYWDSWAHYDQMWGHGNSIKNVNEKTGRYKEYYIGGEVAYNWGNWAIQPGETPTSSVSIEKHRNFVINTIRWLHCTQLKWITNYDQLNAEARMGAEEIQKTFGYRFLLDTVKFSLDDSLKIEFGVTNTGSAPFYYDWPIEVALLDSATKQPVWKAKMDNVDIRKWLPGEGWTDPEWNYVGSWQEYQPNINWNSSTARQWTVPPIKNKVVGKFKFELPEGNYILSLAILDPAGDLPAIKFATDNYFKGGRHPLGLVAVGENKCYPLPAGFQFDNPNTDKSLYYDDDFEISYETDPVQTPYNGKTWKFPADTVSAWQYDYMNNNTGNKYFSLDSANTVGVYGCNDTTGVNIRSYQDSVMNVDAAQFRWDNVAETFQKNGQWMVYTADFIDNVPYQILLRARNNVDANFKLTISNANGEIVFFRDFNVENDFNNMGRGNTSTDWYLSKIAVGSLRGTYTIRFDWYDNLDESGVFGEFSFLVSDLDVTPPQFFYVSIGTFKPGTDIVVMTTEDAKVYLVPAETPVDTTSIFSAAVSVVEVTAYYQGMLNTDNVNVGNYVVYAIDSSNNISAASKIIKLEYPVGIADKPISDDISISYSKESSFIQVQSKKQIRNISIYNIIGRLVGTLKSDGYTLKYQTNTLVPGIYLVNVVFANGTPFTSKIVVR